MNERIVRRFGYRSWARCPLCTVTIYTEDGDALRAAMNEHIDWSHPQRAAPPAHAAGSEE